MRVWSANPRGIARNSVSPADFADLRAQAVSRLGLEALAAFTTGDASTLSGIGDAQRLASSTVSPELFDLLGVRAASGRTLVAADASGDAVVVVSDRLWRTVLSASPAAVGTSLTVDGVPAVIAAFCLHRLGFRRATSICGFRFGTTSSRARDRRTTWTSSVGLRQACRWPPEGTCSRPSRRG